MTGNRGDHADVPAAAGADPAGAGKARLVLLVGVPRSGTSVLHALMSTAPGSSPYAGEASYLRLVLSVLPRAEGVFEAHTRYVFPTRAALRSFHGGLIEQVIAAYAAAAHDPGCLILKDPLMTMWAGEFRALVPRAEVVLMLRHPADVIASRLRVQERLNVPPDPDRLIDEHNRMLQSVLDDWARILPAVVTYPMLAQRSLGTLRRRLRMPGIDAARLWQNASKTYPQDGQAGWVTPLYGAPLQANHRGRNALSAEMMERITAQCMPVCHAVLARAGLKPGKYWVS